ncbi:Non-repetitive/WGA-negative nucleoporin C-terminal-domain-containing protein [Lophiotrema nucula]|uniref:Non-repetitive/WGA-negative nucleoporin C-terminal-domain-containing protein n=1 Tax=Lophiotrema nucula TaxID=690887 RepID=A0A6A5Z209_9PLEO|nr:Non-repetitive/WGA-negative nucleoporin C-terminal-domain-containing protein [Lophiotrema nucula]
MSFAAPPATPQRQAPGSFINTPAPNRPGLFRTSSAQQPSQQPAPLPPAAPELTPIERAAKVIGGMLDKDKRYADLESYASTQGSSGEYDLQQTSGAWAPFQKLRTYEVPERIFEQVNRMQMASNMGLFAEINHAWVTIDNQLYMWDYTHPNPELVGFEEQPNTIISVKLVKPRGKIFVDNIVYLLVVATAAEIFLIAVEVQRTPEGLIHGATLYRTGLSVSVRGLYVRCIEGSPKTGRIFFGDGRDSEDVYELNYQNDETWFQSKCTKTNHIKRALTFPSLPFRATASPAHITQMAIDDTRNLLYTLSSNGSIRIFHMKTATTLDLTLTRPLYQIRTMCSHLVRGSELLGQNFQLVSIDPITAPEAEQMSLMATTTTGCRIYFSTTSGGYYSDASSPPSSMQVRHVRFPPGDGQAPVAPPSNQIQRYGARTVEGINSTALTPTVHATRYAPGSFFCFVRRPGETNDLMFISAPNTGLISTADTSQAARSFPEDGQVVTLGGNVQAIGLVTAPFSAIERPLGFGNELAVQFDKPASEFAIMTHNGIETVRRRRLVDIFAAILKYGGGPEGIEGDVRKIARQYGLPEIASTALAVACGQGSDVGPDARVTKVSDPDVLDFARRVFIEYGGKPQLSENATVDGISVENVRASPRHDGIALYFARLVRSIWGSHIIKSVPTPTGPVLQPNHPPSKLREIQGALVQLQDFLDNNKQNIDGLAGPDALGRASSRQEEVELQGENRALTSLLQLLNNTIEGIAFALVLFEEKLEDILVLLPEESQARVRRLHYEGLCSVKNGKDLAKELVKAIVNRSIMKGSNVETVAEALRRKCGSFCSSDDVVIFKAQENLKKAADVGANADRGRVLLNDSLRLFEQVAKSLSMENLTVAINRYIELEFYAGAIRLALRVASELDRGNKALSWIKDGRPANDARHLVYTQRTAVYDLIFRVIEAVDLASSNQGFIQEGIPSQATRRRSEAYDQINHSEDEVFQNYLYDWYLQKGWGDRLLEIHSSYVVDYLQRSSQENIQHADLLCRYYAHYSDFLDAAEVQFQLAKSSFDLSLAKRIEYLSRAKANASTRMTGFSEIPGGVRNRQSRQELLRSISDHLDIANIQDDILQKIRNDSRLQGERRAEVLKLLDGQIQPLDDLYHSYADQAGYYDICLYIYHAADYRNLPYVRNTWSNLIDQAHKDAVEDQHNAPWEMVAVTVESIGHRVGLNENVFPVQVLMQLLLQYDIRYYTHEPSRGGQNDNKLFCHSITWPIDIFVRLNAPFEMVIATMEAAWYSQEPPFTGRNRKLLVKWIIYAIEQWYETSKRTGHVFGTEDNADGLAELLRIVSGGAELRGASAEDQEWAERLRVLAERVDGALR